MLEKKDIFISYGRKESKAFARKLHDQLVQSGYTAWLDMINIPPGDDYQQRIDNGIESADNFIFIIAPHSLQSEFCRQEIEHAVKCNKRIFPILHIEAHKDDPVWKKVHPVIAKTHWISIREQEEQGVPLEEWKPIDDFGKRVDELKAALENQKKYVRQHTELLLRALAWKNKRQQTKDLLVGSHRKDAEKWLLTEFKAPEQPPCLPTDLHAEYICESKKNAENMMTNMFISSPKGNIGIRTQVQKALARNGITTWTHQRDIQSGEDAEQATSTGIEQADNFLFFISFESIKSESSLKELAYANGINKRVIPLLIESVPKNDYPSSLKGLRTIDFTNNVVIGDFEKDIDQIIKVVSEDKRYFERHKILLSQALKWQRQKHNSSILLRGFNLQNAKVWFSQGSQKGKYQPTALHEEFIRASEAYDGEMDIEVFIAYSRKDGDFARQLNAELELNGKTTWFDQDSITEGADFEEEIKKGIAVSDNFLFIISPDSIQSNFCQKEVSYAETLGKRFINVLLRPVGNGQLPQELSKVQWVNFEHGSSDFQNSFNQLMRTLNIDREHVQSHKKWQQKAMEWKSQVDKEKNENAATELLLGEVESKLAEVWITASNAKKKDPPPTRLQEKFISLSIEALEVSRQKEKQIEETLRRRLRNVRIALFAAFILFLVALASFGVAEFNRQTARNNANQAAKSANEAKSLRLTSVARDMVLSEGKTGKAMSIALEAYDLVKDDPPKPILDALRTFVNIQNFKNLKHDKSITFSAFVPNHELVLTCSNDHIVKLWNTDGSLYQKHNLHSDQVHAAFFSKNGARFITCSRDKNAILWDIDMDFVDVLDGHTDMVTGATISPDGNKIITWSRDQSVRLWQVRGRNVRLTKILMNGEGAIKDVSFSPDGRYIFAITEYETGKLWRSNGNFLTNLENGQEQHPINFARFSPTPQDTWLLLVARNGYSKIYDLDVGFSRVFNLKFEPKPPTPSNIRSFSFNSPALIDTVNLDTVGLHSHNILAIELSPDGSLLLTRSNDEAKLWNMNELLLGIGEDRKKEFKQILLADLNFTDEQSIDFIQFSKHSSPDSLRILTANKEGMARLWKYNGNNLLNTTFGGHPTPLNHIVFSPSAQEILTASAEGKVMLWEVVDKMQGNEKIINLKAELSGHLLTVNSVDFSKDGSLILTGSEDHTAKIWELQENPFSQAHNAKAIELWRKENPTQPLTAQERVSYDLIEEMDKVLALKDTVRFRVYGDHYKSLNQLEEAKLLYQNYEKLSHSPHVFTSLAEVNMLDGKKYTIDPFISAENADDLQVYARFFKSQGDSLGVDNRKLNSTELYKFSEQLYEKVFTKRGNAQVLIEWTDVLLILGEAIDFEKFDAKKPGELEKLALFLSQRWGSRPYVERIPAYKKSAQLYRKLLRKNRKAQKDIAKNKRDLANIYNSLAYYYLYAQQFEKAEKAARMGIKADDTYPWTNTKLALAYLYQGKYSKAEQIFSEYKGQSYGKDKYTERFLGYIDKLNKVGINHPDTQKARDFLEKK